MRFDFTIQGSFEKSFTIEADSIDEADRIMKEEFMTMKKISIAPGELDSGEIYLENLEKEFLPDDELDYAYGKDWSEAVDYFQPELPEMKTTGKLN